MFSEIAIKVAYLFCLKLLPKQAHVPNRRLSDLYMQPLGCKQIVLCLLYIVYEDLVFF